jgi:cbb3-type cytochrome oxidase maturation protein
MEVNYILIPAGIALLSGSALGVFYWAAKTGQFRNLRQGSEVIFDADEPIGKPTDDFPGKTSSQKKSSSPTRLPS